MNPSPVHDRTIFVSAGRLRSRRIRLLGSLALLAAVGAHTAPAAEYQWNKPQPPPRSAVEKIANLDISRRVAARLRHHGVTVVTTRDEDITRTPGERVWLGRTFHADAFVSVHNNWVRDRRADWSEVYHQRGDGLSAALARSLSAAFESGMGSASRIKTRRGRHGDYYWQLRHNPMPSVIMESAFISNRRQAWLLATSGAFRQKIADAIADGVLRWQATLGTAPPVPPYPLVRHPSALVPAPTSAHAWVRGDYDVRVYWTGSTRAQRYFVYRDGNLMGIVNNPDFTPARVPIGDEPVVLSFADRWTSPGQKYRYEIIGSIGPQGASLESRPKFVTAETPAITVCVDPGHGGREPGAIGGW